MRLSFLLKLQLIWQVQSQTIELVANRPKVNILVCCDLRHGIFIVYCSNVYSSKRNSKEKVKKWCILFDPHTLVHQIDFWDQNIELHFSISFTTDTAWEKMLPPEGHEIFLLTIFSFQFFPRIIISLLSEVSSWLLAKEGCSAAYFYGDLLH